MPTASSHSAVHALVTAPAEGGHAAFAEGPAGAGHRDVLVQRLRHLLEVGVDGRQILVLLPDRALIPPVRAALAAAVEGTPAHGAAGAVPFLTYYSLIKRSVELFWPVVAPAMGFANIGAEPAFLTYETAQHVMAQVTEPLLDQGAFGDLTIPRPRLYGQLLSSHNAAAAHGFTAHEIGQRLTAAWTGDPAREHAYEQVQACIDAYRTRCRAGGLVDVALLMDGFTQVLLDTDAFWSFLEGQYRHLLAWRLEENVPVAHDFIRRWLPRCASALLLYEQDGGVRPFLHVSAASGYALREACQQTAVLDAPRDTPDAFGAAVSAHLDGAAEAADAPSAEAAAAVRGVIEAPHRAEMLRAVAQQVQALIADGTPPSDIALIAPAVDGVLQFALGEALDTAGVPLRVLRPRESLRDEPLVRACLTLAELAHPPWEQPPAAYDVTEMLTQFVDVLDPVRAALWVRAGYDAAAGRLHPPGAQPDDAAERIGADALAAAEALRVWVEDYAAEADTAPLDHFVRRFFNDHVGSPDVPPAEAATFSELTRSIGHFRRYAEAAYDGAHPGAAYVRMVRSGVLAAQYPARRRAETLPEAVTLAPAATYLLSGPPVPVQFWLDLGAARWGRSFQQALTNPLVLSRHWPEGETWTEPRDFATRTAFLQRLVRGLCRRCTGGLYLCASDRQTTGEQQDGPLLRAALAALAGRGKGEEGRGALPPSV